MVDVQEERREQRKLPSLHRILQFVCGTAFGFGVSLGVAFLYFPESGHACLFVAAGIALIVGALAATSGDRFWYAIKKWLWF